MILEYKRRNKHETPCTSIRGVVAYYHKLYMYFVHALVAKILQQNKTRELPPSRSDH